jgi:iron(III) transport system ATP-binding protein
VSALEVRGVRKNFGAVRALDGVDLTVGTGTLAAVLGPSGCGKSTLLRCVAGLERVDGGEIRVAGDLVAGPRTHRPTHRRRVALVPQEGALFPHLSVAGNIRYGLSRAERRSGRVDEVLALVGLESYHGRMPHELSGGQQQRVALARALAPRPAVILLDEPFSALDAGLRAGLRRQVRAALRADGATAVLVTHDQGEALSLADHIVVMRDGRDVQSGPPTEVYGEPSDPWVARFVGDAMLLPGTAAAGHARTAAGDAPLSAVMSGTVTSGPVTVLVRPEQLVLRPANGAHPGQVTGHVVRHDFHGHDMLTFVRLADGTELSARRLNTGPDIAAGDAVSVRIEGAVHAWKSTMGG